MFKIKYYAKCIVPKEIIAGNSIYYGAEPYCELCWKRIANYNNSDFYFPNYNEDIMLVVFDKPPVCSRCGRKILSTILVVDEKLKNKK